MYVSINDSTIFAFGLLIPEGWSLDIEAWSLKLEAVLRSCDVPV